MNTFRLFISSTFSDFKKERKLLHKKVFPKIDQYCTENSFTFQPIDLRWGINNEAQLDQKTLEVCLEEVRTCKHFPHPNFLILAGDRYGYIPLPYMIEKKEFELLQKHITKNNKTITIEYIPQKDKDGTILSHKEKRETTPQELLEQWYREDKNQIPQEDNESTAYILQRRDKDYTIYENWESEENRLRELLQDGAKATIKDKTSQSYQKYFLSATEDESIEGINEYGYKTTTQITNDRSMDKEYVFGYLRTINSPDGDYVDSEEKKANDFKENLSKTLLEKNIFKTNFDSVQSYENNDLSDFEEYVLAHLKKTIDMQKDQFENLTSLEKEVSEQKKFKKEKTKGFIGRHSTLSKITTYLKNEIVNQPLIIYGLSGMGKSSLMAKAIEDTEKTPDSKHIIYRFVGATQYSTTPMELLSSLCDELQNKNIISQIKQYESDDNKFYTQIKEIISSINQPVSIFIDALDQLQVKDYLQWLPESLPKNVKLVISILKDENYKEDSHYFSLFSKRLDEVQLINITQDSLEPHKEELVKTLLKTEERRLQDNQINYVLEKWKEANYSPLYLKIAIEEVKNWPSYGEKNKQKLNNSTEGIIEEFIDNLTKVYHHEKGLVDKIFGYIHVSKEGLSEKEILDIISEDLQDDDDFKKVILNDYHDPIMKNNPRRENKEELTLPFSIWSRIHTQLKPFLIVKDIDKQPLMKFFHRQFTTVVEAHVSSLKKSLHVKLADYFFSLQDTTKTWDERYHNTHMLEELPYQLYHAKDSKRLKDILFDLEFAGAVYNNHKQAIFKDILSNASLLEGITEDEIYPWESFYREKNHLISKFDEPLWRPHKSLFQLSYEDGDNSPLSYEAEKLLDNNRVVFGWFKSKNRQEIYSRSGLINVLEGHVNQILGVIELRNGSLLSKSHNSLRIWSKKGKSLAVLKGNSHGYHGAIELSNGNIFSWLGDSDLRLLSKEGKILLVFEGHAGSINGAIELSNGSLLSWSSDSTLRLWSKEGKNLEVLEGHTSSINGAIELSNGTLLSWSFDKTLRLWSKEGKSLKILEGHSDSISNAIELSNGTLLSRSFDQILMLWSKEGKSLAVLEGHTDDIYGAIELSNGTLLSWSSDNTLRLWSKEGKNLEVLEGHTSSINGAIELSNGTLLSWSFDKTLRLWSKEGKSLKILEGHSDSISNAIELSNGTLLSCSEDRTLRIWSKEGKSIALREGHTSLVEGVIELSNGTFLSYSLDNTIRLWSKEGKCFAEQKEHASAINCAIELSNSNFLTWSGDKTLRIWSKEGKSIAVLKGHTDSVDGAIELSNGNLLSYSRDKTLRIWSKEGKNLAVLEGHTKDINYVIELSNGNLLSYSTDQTLRLWSKEGESLSYHEAYLDFVNGAIKLSNGNLLSYTGDNTLMLWSKEGKNLAVIKGHTSLVDGAIELSNGNFLSYSRDKTLRIWSKEGKSLTVLFGHTSFINGVIELSNGTLLSWSSDKTLRLWSKEGKSLLIFEGHIGSINGVIELSNGTLLSWSNDKTLRLWSKEGKMKALYNFPTEPISIYKVKNNFLLGANGRHLLLSDFYVGEKPSSLI